MNISQSCPNPVTILRKFISGFAVCKLRGHGADGLEMFKEGVGFSFLEWDSIWGCEVSFGMRAYPSAHDASRAPPEPADDSRHRLSCFITSA